jgi:hypothetical protein
VPFDGGASVEGRKKIAGILIVAGLVIQLIPVDRSNPPADAEITSPPEVVEILRNSCFDCHSNRTAWPWYSRVAPVSWFLSHDVSEAREEFNFSEWNAYPADTRAELKKEMREEVDEGEMPPWTYTLLHPGARLTPSRARRFRAWTGGGEGTHAAGGEEEPDDDD